MNRKKVKVLILIVSMLPLILTSCWDKKEINERAFVNAIYIEKNPAKKESEMISSRLYERDSEDLLVTYGVANTLEGGTSSKAFTNTVTATTLGDAAEKLNAENTRTPFFGHTKLIVFGKGILENPEKMKMILDNLQRNILIDREIKIIAAENGDVTLEKLRPETENLYSSYVTGVMSAADSIAYSISMNMGDLFRNVRERDGRTIMPIVRVDDSSIKIDKMAFINNYKLIGVAGPRDVIGYKLFRGENGNIREYIRLGGVLTTFGMSSIKRKIKYIKGGDVPKFKIQYSFEGGIESYDFTKKIFTVEKEKELEEKVKDIIKVQLVETADYFQNKIGVDYLGLDDFMKKFHPGEYKKYKDWDEAFKNAEISYDINVNVLRFGDAK